MKERKVKQVILMRNDLKNSDGNKIRTGKLISQGAHASLGVVLKLMETKNNGNVVEKSLHIENNNYLDKWINGIFTKITLKVNSLDELNMLYNLAQEKNIPSVLIEDSGLTEFNGIKTVTCAAIGPYWSDEIDEITKHLKLF